MLHNPAQIPSINLTPPHLLKPAWRKVAALNRTELKNYSHYFRCVSTGNKYIKTPLQKKKVKVIIKPIVEFACYEKKTNQSTVSNIPTQHY